jgi:NAD(P)-dependent dehydrogenase (short-subunit alcohol dehydrogenase family)
VQPGGNPTHGAPGHARIVDVGSIAGKESNPHFGSHCAAEAGVICLTKRIARELALDAANVDSVAPAIIATQFIESLLPEEVAPLLARIPMG